MPTADKLLWIFNGFGNVMWRSRDGGDSYELLKTDEAIEYIVPHPTQSKTLLAQARDEDGVVRLLISNDAGSNFRFVGQSC